MFVSYPGAGAVALRQIKPLELRVKCHRVQKNPAGLLRRDLFSIDQPILEAVVESDARDVIADAGVVGDP